MPHIHSSRILFFCIYRILRSEHRGRGSLKDPTAAAYWSRGVEPSSSCFWARALTPWATDQIELFNLLQRNGIGTCFVVPEFSIGFLRHVTMPGSRLDPHLLFFLFLLFSFSLFSVSISQKYTIDSGLQQNKHEHKDFTPQSKRWDV